MSFYHPSNVEFKRIQTNKYGSLIELPDDCKLYGINPGQRWIPHSIQDDDHPAKVGDIVTLSKYLSERLGISAAIVSRARTFKDVKNSRGSRQVELLGLPMRWFTIVHFKEYCQNQIADHIFGMSFFTTENDFY